jgi:hypothetical protein
MQMLNERLVLDRLRPLPSAALISIIRDSRRGAHARTTDHKHMGVLV